MAKNKKNIDAFQKAMLSNTKMIVSDKKETKETKTSNKKEPTPEKGNKVEINKALYTELLRVAKEYQLEPETIANLSIKLFLTYEDFWFDSKN